MGRILLAAVTAAALLAGCGSAQTVVEADAVIAGRAYRNQPVSLGRVKLRIALQGQVADAQPPEAEHVDLVVGFVATGEPASVVARGGRLRAKKDGAEGELVARAEARGTPLECIAEPGSELSLDYWFNGTARREAWKCVTLRFRVPGHRPGDPLELTFEPINVGGELQRLLPITFAYRTEEITAD